MAVEERAPIQFAELIQLTGPNGRPVWISTAGVRIIEESKTGGSVIEFGPNWKLSVQETVTVVTSLIRGEPQSE